MTAPIFQGTYTALITPFIGDSVDFAKLGELVERQIDGGVEGLSPVGTTGESPTLSTEEHLEVIRVTVEKAAGRVPVIAGTGANSTAEALHLTREAEKRGADGFLQVAPYYNKPGPEGLFRHFAAIAETTDKPIVLYSVPGRCGIEIGVPVIQRLAEAYPHVRTVKEAGGSVARVQEIRAACGNDVAILSGDDSLTLPFIAAGATGVISVAANLAPRFVSKLTRLLLAGDFAQARRIAGKYHALFTDVSFIEGNPVSIKTAMHLAGLLDSAAVRLPLWEMGDGNREKLRGILDELDLSEDVA